MKFIVILEHIGSNKHLPSVYPTKITEVESDTYYEVEKNYPDHLVMPIDDYLKWKRDLDEEYSDGIKKHVEKQHDVNQRKLDGFFKYWLKKLF